MFFKRIVKATRSLSFQSQWNVDKDFFTCTEYLLKSKIAKKASSLYYLIIINDQKLHILMFVFTYVTDLEHSKPKWILSIFSSLPCLW